MPVFVLLTWLLTLTVKPSSSYPLSRELTEKYHREGFYEEGNLFEGDIILRPEQLAYLQAKDIPQNSVKTLIADPTAIWPNKTVVYEFASGEFSASQQARILEALNDIMSVSCVRFVPRTHQTTYVRLRNNGLGCAAAVGYHNYGSLDLYLGGSSCQTRGTIQHEFLHSLGFWHEHTRVDRDQHITILWQNISPGKEFNFYKRNPSEIMTLNTPYDYNSVMHYRSIAFSKDRRSETIVPRVPAAATRMGQRVRFSQIDLAKLNRLYRCPLAYFQGDYKTDETDNVNTNEESDTTPVEETREDADMKLSQKESESKENIKTDNKKSVKV